LVAALPVKPVSLLVEQYLSPQALKVGMASHEIVLDAYKVGLHRVGEVKNSSLSSSLYESLHIQLDSFQFEQAGTAGQHSSST
jgi:hypothetical protein